MLPASDLLSDPAVRAWAAATVVVVLKTMGVGVYTSVLRMRRSVFAAPEDYAIQGKPVAQAPDPEVERARRIHLNDLENGLPFISVGLVYALTHPGALALWICFAGFPAARILHTFFYAKALMPHRTIAFMIGFVITVWMSFASLFALLHQG